LSRQLLTDQRGQDTVEYIGVLAIVAALIGVVMLAVNTLGPTIEHGAECLVAKVLDLNICTSTGPAYPVSASVKTVGYNGRVTIVDGGHTYTITLTKLSNGTSTITAVNDGSLGVSAQWGADVEAGPLGGLGADATVGGGGYGGQTSTWTFPSWSLGQKYFNQISQGSALGLTAHDVVAGTVGEVPVAGPLATSVFDSITGASGAPNQGTLPHKYLSSTSTGGGLQGSADAGAHVNLGPLQGQVGLSVGAQAGVQHMSYGPDKGDWQLVAGLDGNADGSLADYLFGGQAEGEGNVSGQLAVTYSSNGTPETLQVVASGDGVWGVTPPSDARVDVPGDSSGEGGSSGEGASKEAGKETGEAGGDEPLLSIESETSGGSGEGSAFTGTLNLANDPQAAQDVKAILEGNTGDVGDLIDQMNARGTETIQSYQISRSDSTTGAGVSAGAGFGMHMSNGSSNASYKRPETREDGGQWHQGS
jgi:hypothetical protein